MRTFYAIKRMVYLKITNEEGLTLVEVVVAFLVLALVLISSVVVYAEGFQVTKSSGNSLVAYQVAKQDINQLATYEELNWTWPGSLPSQFQATQSNPDVTTVNHLTYDSWYSYISCPYGRTLVVLEVTVVVSWKDGSGNHQYQLTDGLAGPTKAVCP